MLLKYGADRNIKNKDMKTPVQKLQTDARSPSFNKHVAKKIIEKINTSNGTRKVDGSMQSGK